MNGSIRGIIGAACLLLSGHAAASLELLSSKVTPQPGQGQASASIPTTTGSVGQSFAGSFQSQLVAEVGRFENESFLAQVQWSDTFVVLGGPQYLSFVVGNTSTLTAWTSNSGEARSQVGNVTSISVAGSTYSFKDIRSVHCDSFWLQDCSNPAGSASGAWTGHPKLVLMVSSGDVVDIFGYARTAVSADTGIGAAGGTAATATSWQVQVSPIPEPETYALMLLGLALVAGTAGRRRTRQLNAQAPA